eukprot:TRINITY_DN172_c0_g1_i1.p1 TRINITY_DN172_c0_g1~~TRINITY_DN172_c0_g1_i1.p1  ORF type:complete len:1298 (+),score=233.24 TRINITY_DN172_c0_g1_i1:410-3895(+)
MTDLIDAQPNGLPVDKTTGIKELLRTNIVASFSFIYDGDDTNVFTADRIAFMRTAEKHLENDPEFKYHCVLEWIPVTADCPGYDCPWYQEVWDYTGSTPMHGSKLICGANFNSISWVMFNTRIVYPDPVLVNGVPLYNQCDLVNDLNTCLTNGTIALIASLNTGETYDQKRTKVEAGGIPPTDAEVLNFVKLFDRLRYRQGFSWLSPFFDKQFANNTYPKDDPRHYDSYVTRANIPMGGPIERVDPKYINPVCQTRTKDACTSPCIWSTKAGIDMNQEGCIPDQYLEVGEDDSDTQQDQIKDFTDWGKDFTSYYDDISGPVDVLYFADGVMFEKFLEIIMRDALLAIVSFLFVYLYLQIHTGSFFLATLGMIQVIMPFPMGYFVYRVIFQIKAFYGLSTLTLYIVLAIGADDIFVFMDNWVQADVRPRADNCTYMKGRMAHSWKIAGTAMGITSVTTMAAFIATMTSPLMEIGLFGLFAAILVFFDYLLVMTFFAAAVVIYHRNFEHTIGCCCCGTTALGKFCNCCTCFSTLELEGHPTDELQCMQSRLSEPRTFETIEEARAALGPLLDHTAKVSPQKGHSGFDHDEVKSIIKPMNWCFYGLLITSIILYAIGFIALQTDHSSGMGFMQWVNLLAVALAVFCCSINAFKSATSKKNALKEKHHEPGFMAKHVAPFLSGSNGKPFFLRLIPGMILIGFWVVMVIHAAKLHPTTKNDQFLPDWHPVQRYMDSIHNDFPSNTQDFVWPVNVVFGLNANDPIDRSGTDKYDDDDKGVPVFSNNPSKQADLTSEKFQLFVVALCDETLNKAVASPANFLQRTEVGLPIEDQNCIMRNFAEFQRANNRSFPVPPNEFLISMWNFTSAQSREKNTVRIKPYQTVHNKVLYDFGNGDENDPTGIKALYLQFNTTLKVFGNPYDDIVDWYDSWDDWLNAIQTRKEVWVQQYYPATEPFPWSSSLMHTSGIWVWMNTQKQLVKGAITGTIVSLGLATGIIFIASLNIIIAFLVLIELIGVVGCVLGMAYVLGWELGMIESVSITILVGLSVDYVVHFAVHYNHVKVGNDNSVTTERQRRVHEVIADMGPTVLGGAATSVGAAMVLLCTWLQIFYKFGIFFLFTILFSYFWAMFFFLPLMSIFGPQNEFLSLRPLLARCFPRVFGKNDNTD